MHQPQLCILTLHTKEGVESLDMPYQVKDQMSVQSMAEIQHNQGSSKWSNRSKELVKLLTMVTAVTMDRPLSV